MYQCHLALSAYTFLALNNEIIFSNNHDVKNINGQRRGTYSEHIFFYWTL